VKDRSVSLTEAQRSALRAADSNVLSNRRNPGFRSSVASEQAGACESVSSPCPVANAHDGFKGVVRATKLTKDEKVARLISYHESYHHWPSLDYVDDETGIPLGLFLCRAIDRLISLTQEQRSALRAVDAHVFDNRWDVPRHAKPMRPRKGAAALAPTGAVGAAKALTKDDKVALLVNYHEEHGTWPSKTHKDPETGAALGVFLARVIDRSISLNETQRAALRAVDGDLLEGVRTSRSVKRGVTKNVRRRDVVNLLRTAFHL